MNQKRQTRGDRKRHGDEQWQREDGQARPTCPVGPGDLQQLALDQQNDEERECHHPERLGRPEDGPADDRVPDDAWQQAAHAAGPCRLSDAAREIIGHSAV